MKALFNITLALLASSWPLFGQSGTAKVGYVDSDYILSQIPEYKSAQSELDKVSMQWQKDLEDRFAEVEKLYRIFRAEARSEEHTSELQSH